MESNISGKYSLSFLGRLVSPAVGPKKKLASGTASTNFNSTCVTTGSVFMLESFLANV